MSGARLEERVVYHDSCYLGRHNDVYLSPRNVIGSLGGVELVEAGRNGTKGMCCGAGGARMFMEESIGKKVNDERAEELIGTGASKVGSVGSCRRNVASRIISAIADAISRRPRNFSASTIWSSGAA